MTDIIATITARQQIIAILVTARPIEVQFTLSAPKGDQGEQGEQGLSGAEKQASFAWGDATPAIVDTMDAGQVIYSIDLVILVPFDGIGAQLSLGITGSPELFMSTVECDPKTAGVYRVTPGYKCLVETVVRLFITPGAGASTGNGVISIDF